jgi:hypothetical protein
VDWATRLISAYLIDPMGGDFTTIPWETGSGLDWQRLAP